MGGGEGRQGVEWEMGWGVVRGRVRGGVVRR